MKASSFSSAALLALAGVLSACVAPLVQLQPGASNIAINDNRSIERCTLVGLVTATDDPGMMLPQPKNNLDRALRNRAVERGANYVEAMPVLCGRGMPCTQSGNAYRCPLTAADAKPS